VNITKRRTALTAGLLAIAMVAASCGEETKELEAAASTAAPATEEEPAATEAPAETPEPTAAAGGDSPELAGGDVFVTGSSTVEPISIRVGELAAELSGGELAVTVEGPGTGDGFKIFCAGDADVSDASRAIKDEEAADCAAAGVEYVELAVAIDGLTVATGIENSAIECLDNPALYALLGPESEGVTTWAAAAALATELGSKYADAFPDADLAISGPGEESGTYDSFVEFAVKNIAEERTQEEVLRADYSASANDNLIVEGIEGSASSLGWVGYAYYIGEKERMKAIAIENKEGACVAPDDATIADGSYPFSRTLYIYVNKANVAANPAVKSYVDLYLSAAGMASVPDAGYVSLPADQLAASQEAWAAAAG
jgi:phosphate transport system substrate-binding protein